MSQSYVFYLAEVFFTVTLYVHGVGNLNFVHSTNSFIIFFFSGITRKVLKEENTEQSRDTKTVDMKSAFFFTYINERLRNMI